MKPFRRPSVLAVPLAGLLLAAGCGGGGPSREAYAEDVREATGRVDAHLEHIVESQTPEQLVDRIDAAGDQIRATADELESAGAPEGLEDEAGRLVTAIRSFGEELDGTAETLSDPSFSEAVQQVEGLNFDGFTATQQALQELRAAGVAVPLLSKHAPG